MDSLTSIWERFPVSSLMQCECDSPDFRRDALRPGWASTYRNILDSSSTTLYFLLATIACLTLAAATIGLSQFQKTASWTKQSKQMMREISNQQTTVAILFQIGLIATACSSTAVDAGRLWLCSLFTMVSQTLTYALRCRSNTATMNVRRVLSLTTMSIATLVLSVLITGDARKPIACGVVLPRTLIQSIGGLISLADIAVLIAVRLYVLFADRGRPKDVDYPIEQGIAVAICTAIFSSIAEHSFQGRGDLVILEAQYSMELNTTVSEFLRHNASWAAARAVPLLLVTLPFFIIARIVFQAMNETGEDRLSDVESFNNWSFDKKVQRADPYALQMRGAAVRPGEPGFVSNFRRMSQNIIASGYAMNPFQTRTRRPGSVSVDR